MPAEVKPCPCCGGVAVARPFSYTVICRSCGLLINGRRKYRTLGRIIAAWNRRDDTMDGLQTAPNTGSTPVEATSARGRNVARNTGATNL